MVLLIKGHEETFGKVMEILYAGVYIYKIHQIMLLKFMFYLLRTVCFNLRQSFKCILKLLKLILCTSDEKNI